MDAQNYGNLTLFLEQNKSHLISALDLYCVEFEVKLNIFITIVTHRSCLIPLIKGSKPEAPTM